MAISRPSSYLRSDDQRFSRCGLTRVRTVSHLEVWIIFDETVDLIHLKRSRFQSFQVDQLAELNLQGATIHLSL